MAESSPVQSGDEQKLLQAALEHPFEPAEVPLTSQSTPSASPSLSTSAVAPTSPRESSDLPSEEEDTWQTTYSAQVSEWRAQSASNRTKAELTRAKWETIRAQEPAQRDASWDHLGEHITTSSAAATETISRSQSQSHSLDLSSSVGSLGSVEHVSGLHSQPEESAERAQPEHGKAEMGSPSQPWEQIPSSPSSSFPSMSFPDASVPHSPYHQPDALPSTAASARPQAYPHREQNPSLVPTSTLPSIMDNRVAPRTRLSLVLSSLAINLFLPFINGVMLGFGEIFAKDVLVGWFGWKTRSGSTAAGLGLRR